MTQPTQPDSNPSPNPPSAPAPALLSTTTQQVRIGVALFLLHPHPHLHNPSETNLKFLLGHRLSSHGKDTLALPGGHLEYTETFEECAARETLEETGLVVEGGSVRVLTAVNSVFAPEGEMQGEAQGHGQRQGKHYVTIFMVGRVSQADVAMGREARVMEKGKCAGWEWVGWEELIEMARREVEMERSVVDTERWIVDGQGQKSVEGKDQGGAREGKGEGGEEVKRLFQPLRDLLDQRPGVVPKLD